MKLNAIITGVLILFAAVLKGQVCSVPIGAACWGTGGQSVTDTSLFAVHNNPAGMVYNQQVCAGLYQELRYMQPAMQLSAIAVIKPGKYIHNGFGLVQQGLADFNQQHFIA